MRIFTTPWHIAHQHRFLSAFPEWEFDYLLNNVRKWDTRIRPVPKNVHFVPYYEPGKYDFAILHVDQQCTDENIGKGQLYRSLRKLITDIPVVVINHGTPMWPENSKGYGQEDIVRLMKEMVGDAPMVVNSHEAAEKWTFGQAIIHGLNPDDWWDLPKEPWVCSMVSPAGLDRYYNRRLLSATKEYLREKYSINMVQITVEWNVQDHPLFGGSWSGAPIGMTGNSEEHQPGYSRTFDGWDAYRDFLGRNLVYFNPTYDAPMPGARTEAMLSGCCIVTSRYHGIDKIITHGKDGFIVPDNPQHIGELIADLLNNNYKGAYLVGQKGKATAKKAFAVSRYKEDWLKFLTEKKVI